MIAVNMVVIGADQFSVEQHDELLEDNVVAAAANGQMEILSETQLWQRLGMVDPDIEVGQFYTPAMLAQLLELPISTIRRWHRRGLISPTRQVHKLPYFDFQEVASARRLAKLIASGAAPQQIESRLSKLAGLYPDMQRPLSQLSVHCRRTARSASAGTRIAGARWADANRFRRIGSAAERVAR